MLHGMTTIPPVGNDPLAIPALKVLVMMVDQPIGRGPAAERRIERVEVNLQPHLFAEHLDGAGADRQVDRSARGGRASAAAAPRRVRRWRRSWRRPGRAERRGPGRFMIELRARGAAGIAGFVPT